MDGVVKVFPEYNEVPPVTAAYHCMTTLATLLTESGWVPVPHRENEGAVGTGFTGTGTRVTVSLPDTNPPGQPAFDTEVSV